MATPPFSFSSAAPQLPHVSTAAWPNIYAIAIAAIGPPRNLGRADLLPYPPPLGSDGGFRLCGSGDLCNVDAPSSLTQSARATLL